MRLGVAGYCVADCDALPGRSAVLQSDFLQVGERVVDQYETIIQTIALSAGAAWASGINLYAVLVVLGLGGLSGNIELPEPLLILENPLVILAAGLMYCVEFFVDKVPAVDTFWDTLHTFVRIPAGALLAAGALGDVNPALAVAAGIVGGGLSATSHATKAGTRMLINTSPEPFSNWGASITEDVLVLGGMWMALHNPILFLALLIIFIGIAVWALPKIGRFIFRLLRKIARMLGIKGIKPEEPDPALAPKLVLPSRKLSHSEVLTHLERLHRLREVGALNESEFEQQKQVLLAAAN